MVSLYRAFLILTLVCPAPTYAVLNAEPTSEEQSSTTMIMAKQTVWNHVYGKSTELVHSCSATIVGLKPLTLITASHCMRDVDFAEDKKTPRIQIASKQFPELNTLKLRHAIYTEYAQLEQQVDTDVAILIFEGNLPRDSGIVTVPLVLNASPKHVFICGFGSKQSMANDFPGCAIKPLITTLNDFYQILPREYEETDSVFFLFCKTQFDSKSTLVTSLDTLLAVNRLDRDGHYSTIVPMPTAGDSGGPWLIRNGLNNYGLIGITSFIESFYFKNIAWTFFADKTIPIEEFSYVAYGIRLDSNLPRKIIQKAIALGADIKFISAEEFLGE